MTRESWFLVNNKLTMYDCCQSIGDAFNNLGRNTSVYEIIRLKEVEPSLNNPALIEEYIDLVSRFIGIEYRLIRDMNLTKALNAKDVSKIIEEFNEGTIMVFEKVGKYSSNKHLVAAHTLIRYLWYHQYSNVVTAVINLNRLETKLSIEDIFAIAHSFIVSNGDDISESRSLDRALLPMSEYSKDGLLFFKNKEEYLVEISKGTAFNQIFSNPHIEFIGSINIAGDFFEDSSYLIDTKRFISSIDSSVIKDKDNNSLFHKIIDSYLAAKESKKIISKWADKNKHIIKTGFMRYVDHDLKDINISYQESPIDTHIAHKNVKTINSFQ